MEKYDRINRPEHYCNGNMECIAAMEQLFGKDEVEVFCRLNAFKYLWRAPFKGSPEDDHAKAEWYLEKSEELGGSAQ